MAAACSRCGAAAATRRWGRGRCEPPPQPDTGSMPVTPSIALMAQNTRDTSRSSLLEAHFDITSLISRRWTTEIDMVVPYPAYSASGTIGLDVGLRADGRKLLQTASALRYRRRPDDWSGVATRDLALPTLPHSSSLFRRLLAFTTSPHSSGRFSVSSCWDKVPHYSIVAS